MHSKNDLQDKDNIHIQPLRRKDSSIVDMFLPSLTLKVQPYKYLKNNEKRKKPIDLMERITDSFDVNLNPFPCVKDSAFYKNRNIQKDSVNGMNFYNSNFKFCLLFF